MKNKKREITPYMALEKIRQEMNFHSRIPENWASERRNRLSESLETMEKLPHGLQEEMATEIYFGCTYSTNRIAEINSKYIKRYQESDRSAKYGHEITQRWFSG